MTSENTVSKFSLGLRTGWPEELTFIRRNLVIWARLKEMAGAQREGPIRRAFQGML